MPEIIYYVASSLDGFIAGPNEDVSQYIYEGSGVEKYLADLQHFQTVIMGRKTYEFGYKFGMKPGQPAYPHMTHHIFSDTLKLDHPAENVHIEKRSVERIQEIREAATTDIYLCGGGEFAGWLLDNGMIDQLKIKLNPIVLGSGVRLFGNSLTPAVLELIQSESFDYGLQILTYNLKN